MDRMKFFLKIMLIVFIPLIVALSTFVFMQVTFMRPVKKNSREKVYVSVLPDKDIQHLGKEMAEKNLVKYSWVMKVMLRVAVKDKSKKIKPGEYELSPSMTPKQILEKLLSGEVYLRKVKVNPGDSIFEIAKALEDAGIITEKDFLKTLWSREMLTRYGLSTVGSFEGYFSPQTYELSSTDSPQLIISNMIAASESKWPKEYSDAAEELELSRHEVLTIASIIQKEAKPMDYQNLASALYNRSSYAMKLECDSTNEYGKRLPEYIDEDDNPYNTRVNLGFPPSPICSPSDEAIKAVIEMPKTTYLFWYKNPDGTFDFATNRAELDSIVRAKAAQNEEKKQ